MIRRIDAHLSSTLFVAAVLSVAPLRSVAGEAPGDWRYGATLYLWGAGIQGDTAGGAKVDVGFDTLISNLDMAFMGAFEARRDRWSFVADVVYLDVGANESGEVPVRVAAGATGNVNVAASVATTGWVLNLTGAFTLLRNERASLDVLLGARYLDLALDFDLDLAAAQYAVTREIVATQVSWDTVLGVKGRAILDGPWYLQYNLDVGAGESDLTWQAAGGLGYAFDWGDVTLLYRHIGWEFGSDAALDNIAFSGPLLGGTWRF
ncbi:MAG: hypothetical protein KFB96_17845 [Thiocapsa sp.]|uniref:hypothetical protein n=1 Tax=Thiocapsa sp. TaxID=2024551 RepID=UPI001BD0FDD0|nr:hypothetical protein [Thiocapsa sp.]QVL47548.1 MAG: hypothetical protein KFB96_17845 [Thiocapsa sp.]